MYNVGMDWVSDHIFFLIWEILIKNFFFQKRDFNLFIYFTEGFSNTLVFQLKKKYHRYTSECCDLIQYLARKRKIYILHKIW